MRRYLGETLRRTWSKTWRIVKVVGIFFIEITLLPCPPHPRVSRKTVEIVGDKIHRLGKEKADIREGEGGGKRVSRMPVLRLDNVCVTNQTTNEREKKRGLGDLESGACGGVNEKVGELDNDYRIRASNETRNGAWERERENSVNCSLVRFGDFPSTTRKDSFIVIDRYALQKLEKFRNWFVLILGYFRIFIQPRYLLVISYPVMRKRLFHFSSHEHKFPRVLFSFNFL